MAEANNSKKIFKDLAIDKILNIVSITLSIVAIVLSIVAISKTPSNSFMAPSFPRQNQVWDSTTNATRGNGFWQGFGQKGQRNNQNGQANGQGKTPNNQNSNGPIDNNRQNIEPGNANNQNNGPRIDGFRQNNTY